MLPLCGSTNDAGALWVPFSASPSGPVSTSRATIHNDVLAALTLQLVDRLDQIAAFHLHILSLDTLK